MKARHGSKNKSFRSLLPYTAPASAVAVFILAVVVLGGSISALRGENVKLRADLSTLRSDVADGQKAAAPQTQQPQQSPVAAEPAATPAPSADPGLTVASFELKFSDNTEYKYQSYTGTGTIRAADSKDSFLALLKKTLKSGGAPTTKKTEYLAVLVVDGSGFFYTDDSGEGTVVKPDYEFEIIGSVPFSAGGAK